MFSFIHSNGEIKIQISFKLGIFTSKYPSTLINGIKKYIDLYISEINLKSLKCHHSQNGYTHMYTPNCVLFETI